MKKRLVKKWIKLYLDPMVEHLPTTTFWNWNRDTNITLINGERKGEGNMYTTDYNARSAIKKQIRGIRCVLEEFKDCTIYVRQQNEPKILSNQNIYEEDQRKHPKMKFYGIRMRFIIEKVTT